VGLNLAKGSYVCFLDSDDYWHPEFLERCVQEIEHSKKDLAFVYVNTVHVENGNIIGLAKKSKRNESHILPSLLVRGRPWDTSACLWNKEVLDKCDGWISTRNWEDYAFDVSAALVNNGIYAINEPFLYYETAGKYKLSEQDEAVMQSEKSKAIAYISGKLKNSIFYKDEFLKNRVALMIINNTISLLKLKPLQKKHINSNYENLKDWKSYYFVSLFKLLTRVHVKTGLRLLRRLRRKMQKNQYGVI